MATKTIVYSSKANPLYGSLLTLRFADFDVSTTAVLDAKENSLTIGHIRLTDDASIAYAIATHSDLLKGQDLLEKAEIKTLVHLFQNFYEGKVSKEDVLKVVKPVYEKQPFLVADRITVPDLIFFGILAKDPVLSTVAPYSQLVETLKSVPEIAEIHNAVGIFKVPVQKPKKEAAPKQTEDKGKFVELPGAEKGKVIVRFPPEASGYLHIGHAKAALLNAYYQTEFEGKLIMRFDDTNPAKEDAHFEQVILQDLELLGVKPDIWTHSSDYFELMLSYCEKLLKEGKAFVDDTDVDTMREERSNRQNSKNRDNSVEKNLELWEEMKKGTERGLVCCVRIKIDMTHNNGALRDPTIYRCKPEVHVRTGDKYKVYPTYDFACPIVDSHEGVTHALRTTEYHDRDDQFFFICDALGLRKPHIWEYARLNMTHTVMSKRKLTQLVDEHIVDGWDDPRLPTVRGIIRRGLTVEGLKNFILAQGGSRSVVVMEWDKLWAFNKKVIDPIAARYTALEGELIPVHINGTLPAKTGQVNLHPKDAAKGTKEVHFSNTLYVEKVDAELMKAGDIVTFVNWGNLKLTKVEKDSISADLDLDNKDFKKTLKVTWLAEPSVPITVLRYDPVIDKAVIDKDEDWKAYVNKDSKHGATLKAEIAINSVKKGEIIQIQRKNFFICDKAAEGNSPAVFIEIPDGHVAGAKDAPKVDKKVKTSGEAKKGAAPAASNNAAAALHDKITAQGNVVREEKAKDAKSAASKAAIAQLLELKKEFKTLTGGDYNPQAKPAASEAPAPSTAAASNGAAELHDKITAQGNLVREVKAKDAKSAETKAAIAQLLELKKEFKTLTGADYNANAKPASAPAVTTPTAVPSDSAAALHDKITAQGNAVREAKAKDAKSAETKAAIAQLLELKKEYKTLTGSEYNANAKPAAATSAPVSAPSTTAAAPSGAAALHDKITAQGNLVREEKAKDAKSAASKAAIAQLLELKKEFKTLTGADYNPQAKPAAAAPVSAPSTTAAAAPSGAATLHDRITAQGNLVREEKSKDAKSAASKAAIAQLLELKKEFKTLTGADYNPQAKPSDSVAPAAAAAPSNGPAAALHDKITAQGNLVRESKAKDAKSAETKAAIAQLLELKKEYKSLTGSDYNANAKIEPAFTFLSGCH